MAQLQWVRDHLADIESDMSAIHRVDDIWSMPGARFFRLAWRLPAYEGVMRARVMQAHETPRGAPQPARRAAPSRQVNPGTRATIQADPAFRGIFSFG
jgi:hypothetical protein